MISPLHLSILQATQLTVWECVCCACILCMCVYTVYVCVYTLYVCAVHVYCVCVLCVYTVHVCVKKVCKDQSWRWQPDLASKIYSSGWVAVWFVSLALDSDTFNEWGSLWVRWWEMTFNSRMATPIHIHFPLETLLSKAKGWWVVLPCIEAFEIYCCCCNHLLANFQLLTQRLDNCNARKKMRDRSHHLA